MGQCPGAFRRFGTVGQSAIQPNASHVHRPLEIGSESSPSQNVEILSPKENYIKYERHLYINIIYKFCTKQTIITLTNQLKHC